MPKVVIEVLERVNEEKVEFWIAEKMSKELFEKMTLDVLKLGWS